MRPIHALATGALLTTATNAAFSATAIVAAFSATATVAAFSATATADTYAWHTARVGGAAASGTLAARVPPPVGFERTPAAAGSFAAWLRGLPMKPVGSPVLLFTGASKARQDVHTAVVDIDVGKRDLQQCADAIMRLRAEWLWSVGRARDIAFDDTDGQRRSFSAIGKSDYASFRKYMDLVFAYAGTYSLDRELKAVSPADITIGDVFIKGGFPGHAVLIADMARNASGETRFLLVQSYMPAQEIHVLKNPASHDGSPWYATPVTFPFVTPEWVFPANSLKRFPKD